MKESTAAPGVPVTVEVGVLVPVGTVTALSAAVLEVFLVAVLAGVLV